MSDAICNPYPARFVDPNEPGLLAAYVFSDSSPSELSTFSRYINRAALGGAAYDLVTRVGTPLVGHGGGVLAPAGSNWSIGGIAPIPVDATWFGQDMVWESPGTPAALSVCGPSNATQHRFYQTNTGLLWSTVRAGASIIASLTSVTGRGPFVASQRYSNGTHYLYINNRLQGTLVEVASTPAGAVYYVGTYGTTYATNVWSRQDTRRQDAFYRSWAQRVVYSWQPHDVGEGPAGGIPTNAVGEGDWSCPLGGATLLFVWRPDLSIPSGGRLALTETGAVGLNMRRLAFMHPKMPAFGTWDFRFELRDPATDNPRFGLIAQRDTDFTAVGADGYWVQVQRAAGVMQATLHEANGAAVLTVNHTAAGVAGDALRVLLTRHPSGDFRLYLAVRGVWAGSDAVVWNDVTSLSSNYVSIAPRQSYVTGFTRYQGEMTPHELATI